MKIEKYKKLNRGRYKVTFDKGSEIILYEDIILKHSLLLKKEIDLSSLNEILKENEFYGVYNTALNYIEIRQRSKKELYAYLEKKEFAKELINKVIDRLKNEGFLNEEQYIKSFINDKINFTNYGPYKIKKMLIELGLEEEKIDSILSNIEESVWTDRTKKIIEKRKKLNKKNSSKMFNQKTTEYLILNGYGKNMFADSFEEDSSLDYENITRDKEQLLKKLSKKYEGNKLNYELKSRLYKKGYSIDLINQIIEE